MELKTFAKKIPRFGSVSSSIQIDYFSYYLLHEKNIPGFRPRDITDCFDQMNLSPYSNIPSYLSKFSKKAKGQKYLKKGGVYFLENSFNSLIEKEILNEAEPESSDILFPQSIFDNTRGYLVSFAKEAGASYDYALYNCCFFMVRKIMETLIIELFERHSIEAKIKNSNGGYLFLSDLISKLVAEPSWHLTKIVREDIPKIKKLADSSVHSKRFLAKKSDIDNIKTELRIILQELVNLIDYSSWKAIA